MKNTINVGFGKSFGLAGLLASLLSLAGCATPVGEIEKWPITGAEDSQFSGEVVDVLCELTGNCVSDCGAGNRQLAIETKQNALGTVLIAKNLTNYSGAVDELWQYCGQQVELNGLFTEHRGVRFFQIQNVRAPSGEWLRADKYLDAWVQRSGKSPQQAATWYTHDERIKAILKRDGRLGLGTEADDKYFK